MKFKALINVMPHDNLLDPQGKAVAQGLFSLNLKSIENVRIGKHIILELEAKDEHEAAEIARIGCEKLLVNAVMERYDIQILKVY